MEFSEACCEVDFILDNLNPEDNKKIPQATIKFFKENKSLFYKVNLTTSKPLAEQSIKDETKAFLQILNYKYFSNPKQKEEFAEIFKENENVDKMFWEEKTSNKSNENSIQTENNDDQSVELVVYKENKLKVFIKKIIDFFMK